MFFFYSHGTSPLYLWVLRNKDTTFAKRSKAPTIAQLTQPKLKDILYYITKQFLLEMEQIVEYIYTRVM